MKIKELRDMSDEQLVLTMRECEQGLFRLRMQAQKQLLEAPSELRRQRQTIARIKTLQTERQTKKS
jgi:large subunit ribosomal protein L29